MRIVPRTLDTGVAALFVVGSGLFVLGSIPAYVNAVGGTADAVTYATGSVFFTAAATGQLVQCWRPRDRDWLAAVVQLPGTVCFNVSTFAVLVHNATVTEEDHRIWRPDIYGSVLFLIASGVGVASLGQVRGRQRRSAAWWTAWLNLAGSVAFMASAIGSYVLPDSDDLDLRLAVGGTLLGAGCFLVGAVLMFPAWQHRLAPSLTTPHPPSPVTGSNGEER
jgi:hypothetical protein